MRCSIQKNTFVVAFDDDSVFFSSIADFILAAQLFGDNAMAAVNLVTLIFLVMVFLSSIIGMGTTYMYSFEIGAFRSENTNKLVGQGAILAVTYSILLTAILFSVKIYFFRFSRSRAR